MKRVKVLRGATELDLEIAINRALVEAWSKNERPESFHYIANAWYNSMGSTNCYWFTCMIVFYKISSDNG